MNSNKKLGFNQLKALIKFNQDHPQLDEDTNYKERMAPIIAIDEEVSALVPKQEESSKQETEQKQVSRGKLETSILTCVDLLMSYGYLKQFLPFSTLEGYTKSQLRSSSALDLLARANNLRNLIGKYPDESAAAGCGPELKQNLVNDIAEFDGNAGSPKEFRLQHNQINQTIDDELSRFQSLLNNVLKRYMRSVYQKKDAALYAAFLQAIEVDAIPRYQRSLQGTLTDSRNGNPLTKVMVSVDGQKPVAKGGAKGGYFFQNLKAGEHELVFSLKAYQKVVKRIVILPNETYQLDVVLSPIEIEEVSMA